MSFDLSRLLQEFRVYKDFDNETASFRTNVPWLGPEAYLNIIYRPAWGFRGKVNAIPG